MNWERTWDGIGQTLGAWPLTHWVMALEFFLILLLLFLVWRAHRWTARMNQRLLYSQEKIAENMGELLNVDPEDVKT
jgi:hypothetical protein